MNAALKLPATTTIAISAERAFRNRRAMASKSLHDLNSEAFYRLHDRSGRIPSGDLVAIHDETFDIYEVSIARRINKC